MQSTMQHFATEAGGKQVDHGIAWCTALRASTMSFTKSVWKDKSGPTVGGGVRALRTSGTLVRTTASRKGNRSSSVVSSASSFHFFSCEAHDRKQFSHREFDPPACVTQEHARNGCSTPPLVASSNSTASGPVPSHIRANQDICSQLLSPMAVTHLDGIFGLEVVGVRVRGDEQHALRVAIELGQVAAVAPAHVLRAVAVEPVRDVAVGVQPVQDGVRVPVRAHTQSERHPRHHARHGLALGNHDICFFGRIWHSAKIMCRYLCRDVLRSNEQVLAEVPSEAGAG